MVASQQTDEQTTHILVVGAGAVGCFYASRLHHPGRTTVSLVARSNYKAIAAHNGVTLKTRSFGDYHFQPDSAFPSIEAAAQAAPNPRGWDHVIVTTKALPDQVDDAESIAPLVTVGLNGTKISLIQNGVGIEQPHRARFPENPILSCVTVISAEQTSPGVIVQNRWTRISLGPYTDGIGGHDEDGFSSSTWPPLVKASHSAQDELYDLWTAGGIKDVEKHSEKQLQLIRWHKLTINSAFNPSAVLSGGLGNATMVTSPELRLHIEGCMKEILTTAPKILGSKFPDHLAGAEKILKSTERNTGAKPSMLLDWEGSRPMELEVILGNPVRIAREHGIEMPRLQSMYALLKAAQSQREADKQKSRQAKL